MNWQSRRSMLILALLLAAAHASAQEPVLSTALPDSVAEQAIAIYNRDGTIRLSGESEIAAGSRIEGSVAVLNGPLRIAGYVGGDVVIINGGAQLVAGAHITGSLLVIGGSVAHPGEGTVDGGIRVFREPLRFRNQDGRLVYVPPQLERGLSAGREWRFGRTDLFIGAHGSYNRVEGLPVAFGPRVRLGHSNPTWLRALAIYRTATGLDLDPDHMGYELAAEQQLGTEGLLAGVRLYSELAAIEDWQVTDRESSLATFILHRDYRDHYERAGVAVSVGFDRAGYPLGGRLWYSYEDNAGVMPRSPWTLFDNEEPWRPEPQIAAGRLRAIGLDWKWDTRNDPVDPSYGWFMRGRFEQGVGGALELPQGNAPGQGTARTGFNSGMLDIRRYARLSPYATLAVRVFGAGSIDGKSLPPQRQHVLGGEGALPAFALMQFDCAARSGSIFEKDGEPQYPYYGCDRSSLIQLEYQASFPFARRLGDRLGISSKFTNAFRWVAFLDAGRAWTETDARDGRGGGSSDYAADFGIGVRIGALGAYWAVPLSGSDKQFNFFVRVGPQL